jgi:type I restriction-modification system DNA methylase subunit
MKDADLLEKVKDHIRNRSYMSGVDREYSRVKATGEVFTPTTKVQHILNNLERLDPTVFKDPVKTFIDNSCGDGQILSEALIRKLENGIDFKQALSTIYGVDLMQDNVKLCQDRLLCGREDLRHIVEQNIVCADALRYHYRFDGSHPYDDEVKEKEKEEHLNSLFSFE